MVAVGAGEDALAAVEDLVVGGVPALDDLRQEIQQIDDTDLTA
ncbi:hypothetical protein [Streptomyces sp. NPDC002769]